MAIKGSVPAPGVIVPHLVVKNATEAVAFYVHAFSAEVLFRSPSPSGNGEHVHLKVWNSLIQVSTEEPVHGQDRNKLGFLASPESLSGSTCVFQVGVADVDEAFERAVERGASPVRQPRDMFWGDRYSWICDPFGHLWALCKVNEILSPAEIEDRLRGFAAEMQGESP